MIMTSWTFLIFTYRHDSCYWIFFCEFINVFDVHVILLSKTTLTYRNLAVYSIRKDNFEFKIQVRASRIITKYCFGLILWDQKPVCQTSARIALSDDCTFFARCVHHPWGNDAFPPCFGLPAISKKIRSQWKVSQFYFSKQVFLFSSAKISDDPLIWLFQ